MTFPIVLLFAGFLIGSFFQISCMLERKRTGRSLEWHRLVFFFLACLMLVCQIVLWLSGLLTREVLSAGLAATLSNLVGWLLTFEWKKEKRDPDERSGLRTYTVYYQGEPYGLITRETFDRLLECKLLKKQRTIELVDDYQRQARQRGVKVLLFKTPDGSQTLVKIEEENAREKGKGLSG